jgi:hypothetical protein
MREGIHKIKALLGIELFEISNNFMYKLRNSHPDPDDVFDFIPKYTINTNQEQHHQPMLAEYYMQFIGIVESESYNTKFLCFNVVPIDATLKEEIDNAGVEDLFKSFDFKKILSNFTPQCEDDISNFVFPHMSYLVIEMTYDVTYDHYGGGYDCEMELDIIGYLNNDLEQIKF